MSAPLHSYPRVIVALGSNLGDSGQILQEAFARLETLASEGFRASSLWSSDPVDCPPGSPKFVNAVAVWVPRAGDTPESILALLQELEREFGRRPKVVMNEPRPLDLDLIAFGSEKRDTAELILPHPRARLRRFVLAPLTELLPEYRFPGDARTVCEILGALPEEPRVELHAKPRSRGA